MGEKPKIHMVLQKTTHSHRNLKQKEQSGNMISTDFRVYYKEYFINDTVLA